MKIKESYFASFYFHVLAFICQNFASRLRLRWVARHCARRIAQSLIDRRPQRSG